MDNGCHTMGVTAVGGGGASPFLMPCGNQAALAALSAAGAPSVLRGATLGKGVRALAAGFLAAGFAAGLAATAFLATGLATGFFTAAGFFAGTAFLAGLAVFFTGFFAATSRYSSMFP